MKMGHSKKHPYHSHRGNRKLTPLPPSDVLIHLLLLLSRTLKMYCSRKSYCSRNRIPFLSNSNMNASHLNMRGLHLNRQGSLALQQNLLGIYTSLSLIVELSHVSFIVRTSIGLVASKTRSSSI